MAEQVDQVAADTVIEAIKHARHGPPELGRLLDEQVDPAQLTRDMEPLMAAPALPYSVTTTATHHSGTAVGLDLRTQDGRWWHLDASVTASAPPRFTALRVHARPPAFNGRPGGLIVCVFGPSSSGKSALMEALADQAGTPWTRFDEMFPGQIPIRYLIWPGAAGPMRPGFLAGVSAFARAGNQVALSAAPDPDVRAAFDGIATVFVHLTARLEILLARQADRRDRWAGLAEETHAADQGRSRWDLEIDTSAVSAEDAARQLISYLEETGLHGLEEPDLAGARLV